SGGAQLRLPDLARVLLHPPGLRIARLHLVLLDGHHASPLIEEQRAGRRRPFVQCKEVSRHVRMITARPFVMARLHNLDRVEYAGNWSRREALADSGGLRVSPAAAAGAASMCRALQDLAYDELRSLLARLLEEV